MNETLNFEVKMRSITHLGRKLYDNVAAALAELVANSWDAYATNVNIEVNSDKIIIKDDGTGMNLEDLQKYYCPIGLEKDISSRNTPSGMTYRPPMGKKGIGKLAAFSLGNSYKVITKTTKDNIVRSFSLYYDEMVNKDGDHIVEVIDVTESNEYYTDENTGFCVEVNNIRSSIDDRTITPLINRLSRRFSILSDLYEFNVFINGMKVEFNDSYLSDKIQYIWVFAESDEEKEDILKNFMDGDKHLTEKINYRDGLIKYIKRVTAENGQQMIDCSESTLKITGWIGTFFNSGDTKTADGDNLNTIQVIYNNKLADEDFMRKISGKEVARSYLAGRVRADFISSLDDPITSSRQGLDDSVPEILELIKYVNATYKEIVNYWSTNRSNSNREKLLDRYPQVKGWIEGYENEPDAKKVINSLFNNIGRVEFNSINEEKIIIRNAVLAFENALILKKMFDFNSLLEEEIDIAAIVMEFNTLTSLEAMKYREIIRSRLEIVKSLEAAVEKNEKEKVLHMLIADNLWLVDQSWDSTRDISRCEKSLADEFNETDERIKYKRFDILFKKPHVSDLPILIELKRPDALSYSPTRYKAEEQIDNYRKSAAKYYNENYGRSIRYKDIEGIFIWQDDDKFKGEDSPEDIAKWLRDSNLKILKYSEIINNVETNYRDFLNASNDLSSKLGFLNSENWNVD